MSAAVSIIVSVASFLVSVAATWIAWSSLSQAKQVARHARGEWKQRQWFELYFKANEVSDSLDHFQAQYGTRTPGSWGMPDIQADFNELLFLMRRTCSMAVVFPKTDVLDKLLHTITTFGTMNSAMLPDRLKAMRDAVEELRLKALVDADVLD